MRPRHTCGAIAMFGAVLLTFVPSLSAQEETAPRHVGFPQDWSQHHVVFSRDGLALHPEAMKREARVRQQVMQRFHSQDGDIFQSLGPEALQRVINPYIGPRADGNFDPLTISTKKPGPHRDWNVSFVAARLGPHVFPAKYSFDPSAPPDCVNDFVVYGLSIPGVTGGQANLVGFNNLYVNSLGTGLCPGTAPNVIFAYNISGLPTTGKIVTSPILSEDGKKIGFVESGTGADPFSIFHVLTWATGEGTITDSVAPTAAEMTSLTLTTAQNCTTSAPWIDFDADVVYLGDDTGNLYKIDGAFKGTPTPAGGNWPIPVSPTKHLSPPVLDSTLGLLMVGSQNGNLFQIDTATGLVVETLLVGSGGTTSGIVAPPVVDITNGTTFVVSANDGTSAVLVEADTPTLHQLAAGQIGQGSVHGTALRLYEPAFSNAYYNNPTNGDIRLCGTGTGDQSPWQYSFGFSGRIMNSSSSFSSQLITSVNARCTGWTEFFNPNVGPGGTDYFFFGLSQDCTGTGVPNGCLAEITDTDTTPLFVTLSGGPSGIVADNYSTAAEASSIYMAAEGANIAYKFTQQGLQ